MNINTKSIVEVLIFGAPQPIKERIIAKVAGIKVSEIDHYVGLLNQEYESNNRSFRIKKIAGGYSFYSIEEYSGFLEQAFPERKYPNLSRSVIEVLAIIALEQPVTKRYIEKIRGSSSDTQLKKLVQLGFIIPVSRLDTPGKPYLFGTTDKFLKYFGISKVEDIPKLEELKELLD